eukprot:TRINITY_DN22954_c0_g1_i3.p1 TRINITY_DN22954_c0_g1~~TRINITY_DN22954_c0_g1_i3.p1  ORF type:complete len:526 (+),score=76.16 TRINITY_DN22954_c0_g1_i3:107-1684(+)
MSRTYIRHPDGSLTLAPAQAVPGYTGVSHPQAVPGYTRVSHPPSVPGYAVGGHPQAVPGYAGGIALPAHQTAPRPGISHQLPARPAPAPLQSHLPAHSVRHGQAHHGNGQNGQGHTGHNHEHAKTLKGVHKLPVIILTGYLGAGKTTLLNYILHQQQDKKLAVIENEVGEVSIDDALVEQKHQDMAEELMLLDNGCICCTIRGDLVKTLQSIAAKHKNGTNLDGVLIELTGVADPAPVVQTFHIYPDVANAFYVDNVVALVDAKHALDKLDESKDPDKATACAQIAFSSTVLLNKVDLVSPEQLPKIESCLKKLNATVDILRCEQARVPMSKLFNVSAFSLERILEEQYMDEDEFNSFYQPKMDRSVSNVGVRCQGALNMGAFQCFLNKYLGDEALASDFLRTKAVLNIAGMNERFVVQCVHMVRNQDFKTAWGAETRENRIIFIGRGMQQRREELTQGFLACIQKPLRFSVGTKVKAKTGPGPLDWEIGHIIEHWDGFRPYRMRLLSGEECQAPMDDDAYIMRA